MTTPELFADPRIRVFHPHEYEDLRKSLDRAAAYSQFVPLSEPAQLQISSRDGRTRLGGRRYTYAGFSQVTRALAPGLVKLIPGIWGDAENSPVGEPRDHNEAATIFNSVVDLRFDRVRQNRLVVDTDHSLIDGIVTPSYQPFGNTDFLESVASAVSESSVEVVFHEAVVAGRRLSLRYRSRKPLFRLLTPAGARDAVYLGYYYHNGETHGTSVRAARALITRHGTALWFAGKGGPSRAAHRTGSRFEGRVEKTIRAILVDDVQYWLQIKSKFQRLTELSLDVPAFPYEDRQARMDSLTAALSNRRMPRPIARDIIEYAVFVGHAPTEKTSNTDDIPKRTAYDVFCALVTQAPRYDLDHREKLERLAYELLINHLSVT